MRDEDSFLAGVFRQLFIVSIIYGGSCFFQIVFGLSSGFSMILSGSLLIVIMFIHCFSNVFFGSTECYKLFGWLTYRLHTKLENDTRYRGIFLLEKIIDSYMGLMFNPNNSKSYSGEKFFKSRTLYSGILIFPKNIIYELNNETLLLTYGDSLNIIIDGKKCKTVDLDPFNKYAYFGFMLWNVIICKHLGDMEDFNNEMTLLIIDKI